MLFLSVGRRNVVDYRACIQQSIDYIEDHLQEPITVDHLARIAGFSPYHYYRIFQVYVGIAVMDYIRRRRLAYAAAELARGKRILDVALDYGFETHNGFAKAFRKVYGCSPEAYRPHVSGRPPKKVDLMLLEQVHLTGGIVVEPKIITKPAVKIAGYELQTTCRDGKNLQEIPAFWQDLMPDKQARLHSTLPAIQHNEYAICFPPDSATGDFSYIVGLEVPNYDSVPPDMWRGEVPEATYAVFTVPPVETPGPAFSDAIQGTWGYIFSTWFPDSGYELAEGKLEYEFYYSGTQAEIYIPIIKKS
jgi:AraC family transcriptional regulator